ncbi:MAG: cation transporter [Candidatus Fonsibacter lacus]|jgi:cation diffusion facilitator family transporter|uniref:Cation transporter n=1 Tax=Candidatus Fonsibacter lacus TaxID=2576439 RepID=A0A966HTQ5_9PROT|nr:cation transporter [Candidatus Fonsibacter lacus]NDC44318.1 cation transporter [Pseudomonadota bacterium]
MSDSLSNYVRKRKIANKSTWTSVVVNFFLVIFQIVVGLFSKSSGLIADGFHTLADMFSDLIVLITSKKSLNPPDDDHNYGHHRYENAVGLFLGVLLLFVGCAMIWSAGKKLENSDQIVAVHVTALYASIICLVIKELLFRYLLNVAKRAKSSLLLANAWHARSDAASSLVVAIGIIFNLLGYHSFDLIAAIIVGVMILKMGWTFSYEAIHALTDKAADTDEVEKIKKTILETPGVVNVHDLRTRKVGDSIIADVHIEVKGTLTVAEGHAIAVEARNRVMRSSRVLNLMTHIDPV